MRLLRLCGKCGLGLKPLHERFSRCSAFAVLVGLGRGQQGMTDSRSRRLKSRFAGVAVTSAASTSTVMLVKRFAAR